MKLSIIIPTFNSASVLPKALDSIVCQTFTDWEVLIMDGVSTDDTLKAARSYNDNRIRIYSEPDKGIYDAMNKGITKANGEWLYFLGSDDWLMNADVFSQIFSSDVEEYDVIYGDVESEGLSPQHSGAWAPATIDFNRCHQCIFYRRKVFQQLGPYNLKYPVWADHDFNIKWFFSKHIKNKYLNIKVAHYSDGGYSSHQTDDAFLGDLPYLKLKRGHHYISRRDKITLINLILHNESDFFSKIKLHLWKAQLNSQSLAKSFISQFRPKPHLS